MSEETGSDAYLSPEARARVQIDAMLEVAGWTVQNRDAINLAAGRGVAVREFLVHGNDEADHMLFVDGEALGVLAAKQQGVTLTGAEPQSAGYAAGLPAHVPAPVRPLPFRYEATGVETRFTNGLDPEARSREVFAVHQPATAKARHQTSRLVACRPKTMIASAKRAFDARSAPTSPCAWTGRSGWTCSGWSTSRWRTRLLPRFHAVDRM